MYRIAYFGVVALLATAMAAAAEPEKKAASPSELLEKGIYTEETVGDLDGAISIYEKVVAEAKAVRALAAEALYRVGQCLLKKGKKAEAEAAFQKLIADFPDQKDWIAKARKHVHEGISLGPVPWVDGETLQLRYCFRNGTEIGTIIYTAQSAELAGRKIWRVGSRQSIGLGRVEGFSRVDADWDTFRPIESCYDMTPVMGKFSIKFMPTQLIVTSEGASGKANKSTIDETRTVYDNEQAMDLIRRLPLAPGYKITLPILGIGGSKVDLPLEVMGKESVKVPAGEFECFKIHLDLVNQTFWYSADAHRYLVKFDANAVIAELTQIGRIEPGALRRFEDEKLGLSLAAPSDWFFYVLPRENKGEVKVNLLDPRATAMNVIFVGKTADLNPEERKSLRAWADAVNVNRVKEEKDYKVRPDSWREGQVAGLPSLSYLADYSGSQGRKMVEYRTYLRNESVSVKFSVSVRQEDFDGFRKQFDPIIDSLKVKQP
jgi:hypothetical protein